MNLFLKQKTNDQNTYRTIVIKMYLLKFFFDSQTHVVKLAEWFHHYLFERNSMKIEQITNEQQMDNSKLKFVIVKYSIQTKKKRLTKLSYEW